MQWEYKRLTHECSRGALSLENAIGNLGLDGWEMICIIVDERAMVWEAWFKRRVQR